MFYADLHCHPHFGSFARIRNSLEALEWVYFTAVEHDISEVVFLGDFFHNRQLINTFAYHQAYKIILKHYEHGIFTHFLIGNHDMYLRTSWAVNSIEPMAAKLGAAIVSPQSLEIGGTQFDCMPYLEHTAKGVNHFFPKKKRAKILLGHIAISGAVLNTMHNIKSDLIVEEEDATQFDKIQEVQSDTFKGYDLVLLGHYHAHQKVGDNIWYVGSPLQLHWGEALDEKYVCILDTDTFELEWVKNFESPQHMPIPFESVKELDKYQIQGNYIRLLVDSTMGTTEMIDLKRVIASRYNPRSLDVITIEETKNGTSSVPAVKKNIEFLTKNKLKLIDYYVDNSQLPEHLDPTLLKNIGKELVQLSEAGR